MSKQPGCPKTGGRKKGTPNKVTGTLKEWLEDILNENRQQIKDDLAALKPKDRLLIIEKLLQYVIPKQKTELEITGLEPQQAAEEDLYLQLVPEEKIFVYWDCQSRRRWCLRRGHFLFLVSDCHRQSFYFDSLRGAPPQRREPLKRFARLFSAHPERAKIKE